MISNNKNYYKDPETLFPLFMDISNDIFVVVQLDDELKIEFINSCNFMEKLGYSHDSLVGTSFLNLINSDDKMKMINLLKNNVKNEKLYEEMRIESSVHDSHWVEITLKKIISNFANNKALINLKDISKRKDLESRLSAAKEQIIGRDLTESELTEEKLIESEEKFRTLFELAPASTVVSDAEGKIILYNQKFCKLHRVKRPELLKGRTVLEFFAKKDWPRLMESIRKTAEGILQGPLQYTMLREDGTQFEAEANSSGIRDKNGKIVNLIGVAQDITERNKIEQRLRDSDEKYRELADLLPDTIFETDINLNLTYVNSVAFDKFGYALEDFKSGLNVSNIIHPTYREKALIQIKALFEGKETKPNDYLLCKKDGSCFYARIHSRPIYKDGAVVGIRGTITDIDEEKFRTIADQSFMGIIIIQDGIFKYFNEQAVNLNGFSEEEIKEWKPYEFAKLIHPDDKEFVMEQARKKEKGDQEVIQHYKYRIITKLGKVRWVENYSKTINYKGRSADFVMTIDVTNKIHGEKNLKDSEEKYRLITENSQNIVYTLDMNLNNTYISPSVYSVLGYDADEALLMQPKDNTHEDDLEKVARIYKEEFKIERKKDIGKDLNRKRVFTIREKHKDGRLLIMEHSISWLRDENGVAIGILGVARDVTEKENTEKLLKESGEKYRKLFENSPTGLMEQDFSEMKKYIDLLRTSGINNFGKYFEDYPEEILKCITKVKVIDVNRKAVEVHRSRNKEDLISRMNQIG
ncbi:MAG: PAS domain S-box protein, partial [Promethearchaeota archaeon]